MKLTPGYSTEDQLMLELERLMSGFNFVASFGIEKLEDVHHPEAIAAAVRRRFPGSELQPEHFSPVSRDEFFETLRYAQHFRGDEFAGLSLTGEQEKELAQTWDRYLQYLDAFMKNEEVRIYRLAEQGGLGYYDVFWGYCYVLHSAGGKALHIHASASD